jgi:hypothetical protein
MANNRRRSERAYRPSREEMSKLMGGDRPGTSIAEGLSYSRPGQAPAAPPQTREQILAEVKARDPDSWSRAEAARKQKHERAVEATGDTIELHTRRFQDALEDDDSSEALVLALGRAFANASPEGFRAYCSELNDAHLANLEEAGYDPFDDDDFPDEASLAGNFIFAEVATSLEHEEASRGLAETSAKLAGIEQASSTVYRGRLSEAGLAPDVDNPESVAYYVGVRDYIYQTSGINLPELIADGKGDEAAQHFIRANAYLESKASEGRVHEWKQREIHNVEDGSISSGLETGSDRTAAELAEIKNLLRAERGLGSAGEPEIGGYDPNWAPEQAKEVVFDPPETITAFKESLKEGTSSDGGPLVSEGLTMNGRPVTAHEASGREKHAQELETMRRSDLMAPPRSFD